MPVLSRALMLTAVVVLTACATAQENPHYKYSTKYKGDAPNSAYASAHTSTTQEAVVHSASHQTVPATAPISYTRNTPQTGTANSITVHNSGTQPITAPYFATSQTVSTQANLLQATSGVAHSGGGAAAQHAAYQAPAHTNSSNSGYPVYSRINATCVASGQQGTLDCTPQSISIGTQTAQIARPYQSLQITGADTVMAANRVSQSAGAHNTVQYSASNSQSQEVQGTPGYEAMKNAQTGWSENTAIPAPAPAGAEIVSARMMDMQPRSEQSYALGRSHVVEKGDTVYSFSRQLCSSIEDIKDINGLGADFGLKIGQTIRLPASNC